MPIAGTPFGRTMLTVKSSPPDEFLGAVERVDQEEHPVDLRQPAGGDRLLGDHRHAGRDRRKRGEDDRLGGVVRLGDGRGIRLVADRDGAGADLEDGLARGNCSGNEGFGELAVGDLCHGRRL
jgi:hypothetical protein